jgi:nucleoside-diphosphate-sugar epimerase
MRIFVAGATGATGRVFVSMADALGRSGGRSANREHADDLPTHELVLHVRPQSASRSPLGSDPRARILDLADEAAATDAMRGCDAAVSFVGTMRKRFEAGDTYESSDLASTRQIVAAAKAAGVPRILLLSSHGAGGMGAYLKMKAECEDIVRLSGLRFTILRPSILVSPEGVEGTHGSRRAPPGLGSFLGALRHVPGLGGWADDTRPIPIETVCRAFLAVLDRPMDGMTLSGRDLWTVGA